MKTVALVVALALPDIFGVSAPAESPDVFGVPPVSACPCPTGGECSCPPGECDCPGCPAKASTPDLIATVADRGCPPCERWEAEVYPELVAKGWDIRIDRVPFGSATTPTFSFQGRTTDRYDGKAAFFAWLKARPLPATKAVVPATSRVVVTAPVVRSIPPARRTWSYSGSDLAGHLRRTHGVDPSGMSHAEMVRAHSHAHEGTWGSVSGGYAYSAPVRRYSAPAMRSGCPGGNCPSSSSGGGFFRRLFR